MSERGGWAGGVEVRRASARDPLGTPTVLRDLAHRYFIFDPWVAGDRRVDLHPLVLSPSLHAAAVRTAESVARAIGRATTRAQDDDDEAARYGFDDDTLRLARASHRAGDDAAFMRVDLLLDERGTWQACEINADCPGGHNESVGLPRLARVVGFFGGSDPTNAVGALARRLAELADGGVVALVYATAYAEDLQVCAIVRQALEARGVRAVLASPTALRERAGMIHVGGTPVRVLYRFFPTEWMAGQKNLPAITSAIAAGRLRTLSSFAHVFTQSKLGFARAIALSDDAREEDQRAIGEHVPFSADLADLAPGMLAVARPGWVVKRAMGRVGDQVFVGALHDDVEWRAILREAILARERGESWIAQRYVRQRPIATPWGPRYVTLGAYLLDGRFVGYFARITPETHVSFDALCVPVFVDAPVAVAAEHRPAATARA